MYSCTLYNVNRYVNVEAARKFFHSRQYPIYICTMSVLCPPPKDSADDISVFCHQAESEPKSGLLMTRDMERVFWFYQSLPNPIHHEAWSQGRKIARFQGRIIARFQRGNIECFQGRNIECFQRRNIECFQGRKIARFQERNNTRRRLDWRSIRIWDNQRWKLGTFMSVQIFSSVLTFWFS